MWFNIFFHCKFVISPNEQKWSYDHTIPSNRPRWIDSTWFQIATRASWIGRKQSLKRWRKVVGRCHFQRYRLPNVTMNLSDITSTTLQTVVSWVDNWPEKLWPSLNWSQAIVNYHQPWPQHLWLFTMCCDQSQHFTNKLYWSRNMAQNLWVYKLYQISKVLL